MSDSKNSPNNQPEIIKSRDELLKFFGMPHAVNIPEFKGVAEFTRAELDTLKKALE